MAARKLSRIGNDVLLNRERIGEYDFTAGRFDPNERGEAQGLVVVFFSNPSHLMAYLRTTLRQTTNDHGHNREIVVGPS